MRRISVLGFLTIAVLLVGMVSPVVYGQALTPTATSLAAATASSDTSGAGSSETGGLFAVTITPGPAGAPGRTGTNIPNGVPIDSAPAQVATDNQQEVVRQASEMIGSRVRSSDDRLVGRIDNLVVSPGTGDLAYALVASGGFLGLSEKLVAVPMSAFYYDLSADEFVLSVDGRTFEQAPSMDRYSSIKTNDLGANSEVQSFWSTYMGSTGSGMGSTGTVTGTGSFGSGTRTGTGNGAGAGSTGTGTAAGSTGTGTGTSGTGTGSSGTGTGTSSGGVHSGPLYTVTPIATPDYSVGATATPTATALGSTSSGSTGTGSSTGTGTSTGSTGAGSTSIGTPAAPSVSGSPSAGAGSADTGSNGAGLATSGLIQVGGASSSTGLTASKDLVRVTELGAFSMLSCPAGTSGSSTGTGSTGTGAGTGTGSGVGTTGTITGSGTMTDTTGTGAGTGSTGTGTGGGVGTTGTGTDLIDRDAAGRRGGLAD